MDPNSWDQLLECILFLSTANTLLLYMSTVEKVFEPQSLLDRLNVVWMLKQETAPFHEISIIETEDTSQRNKIRGFNLEHIYHTDGDGHHNLFTMYFHFCMYNKRALLFY